LLGELGVEAYGDLATSCSVTESGTWACGCQVGSAKISFDLEGDQPGDVCEEANETCRAELDLESSAEGGDYYYY
jgi:hypothetical protein